MSKLRSIIQEFRNGFKDLSNKVFAKLNLAETISLQGNIWYEGLNNATPKEWLEKIRE